MADEVKPEKPADDQIKNLKAEMDRKLGNIEKSNQDLLATLKALSTPAKKEPVVPAKTPLKDLWYDDPEAAADVIANKATNSTLEIIQKQNQIQAKQNNTIQQLYKEYPELVDYENPLTVKAVEIFNKFSDEEKANPIAYRLAAKEAADELDIKPKAKRKPKEDEDDSFSLGGGGDRGTKTRGKKSDGLDDRTVKFAELVGMDVKDPKVIEGLKKSSQRKNWMTWE